MSYLLEGYICPVNAVQLDLDDEEMYMEEKLNPN